MHHVLDCPDAARWIHSQMRPLRSAWRGSVTGVGKLSKRELDALVEEAIVDAYDEYEQTSGFAVMIADNVAFPFKTVVLGVEVTVTGIDEGPQPGITAVCRCGKERQRIGILDLPLPSPPPAGSEWIEAYRHWLTGE